MSSCARTALQDELAACPSATSHVSDLLLSTRIDTHLDNAPRTVIELWIEILIPPFGTLVAVPGTNVRSYQNPPWPMLGNSILEKLVLGLCPSSSVECDRRFLLRFRAGGTHRVVELVWQISGDDSLRFTSSSARVRRPDGW